MAAPGTLPCARGRADRPTGLPARPRSSVTSCHPHPRPHRSHIFPHPHTPAWVARRLDLLEQPLRRKPWKLFQKRALIIPCMDSGRTEYRVPPAERCRSNCPVSIQPWIVPRLTPKRRENYVFAAPRSRWCFNSISHRCICVPLQSCWLRQQRGPAHRLQQSPICAVSIPTNGKFTVATNIDHEGQCSAPSPSQPTEEEHS